ncbi:MAG: ATP-binding protein, partial [Clostridia bacterium]|nr:ATP-binding protein [Clostridia bacterium]
MLEFDAKREANKLNTLIAAALNRMTQRKARKRCELTGPVGAGKTQLIANYVQSHTASARYFSCRHANAETVFSDFLHLFLPNEAAPSDRNAVFEMIGAAQNSRVPVLFVEDEDCAPDEFRAGLDTLHERKLIVIHVTTSLRNDIPGSENVAVPPRTIWHFKKALPQHTTADAARLWAITGGLPAACKEADADLPLEENLRRLLHFDSSLVTFFPALLTRTIRVPDSYYPILEALAHGKHRTSEIAKAAGYPNNKADTYLKALIERQIVAARKSQNDRSATYHLTNSYFKFWMLYIYPNRDRLIANPESVLQMILQTIDKTLMLPEVQGACLRYLQNFSYQHRSDDAFEFRWAAAHDPQAYKVVSFTFKDDGYKANLDFMSRYNGVTYLAAFPHDTERRFTKEDIERYYKIAAHYAPRYETRLLLFSFHRFSDWCVKESAETQTLYCVPV